MLPSSRGVWSCTVEWLASWPIRCFQLLLCTLCLLRLPATKHGPSRPQLYQKWWTASARKNTSSPHCISGIAHRARRLACTMGETNGV